MKNSRRTFLKQLGLGAASLGIAPAISQTAYAALNAKKPFFEISLAQFSLASEFFGGKMNTLDFPAKARNDFGINAVEYVSMFFRDKANDQTFLRELKQRTADSGVRNVLIMIDMEGPLADPDEAKRRQAVEDHYKWVDAAKFLGCHSVRVNLQGEGSAEEVAKAAVDGYGRLVEYGAKNKIGVIVENHGGHSSNGQWLAGVMKQVNNPYAGTLPDFGNFCIERTQPETNDINGYMNTRCLQEYDKYTGVAELMPFAKGVSAKTHRFDANGNEAEIDFVRMLQIIKKGKTSAFKGYIGIEYEGGLMRQAGKTEYLSNDEGIMATKRLLERAAAQVS